MTASLWQDTCEDDPTPRPALDGDTEVDVAIVGAGLTGLWTAYYLTVRDPALRIAVLEQHTAGFGASGRNGGWASALFPASRAKLARLPGSSRASAIALGAAMRNSVDEVGRVAAEEGIDCGYVKGGTVVFARTPVQVRRAQAEVREAHEWGDDESDLRYLDRAETEAMAKAAGALGATYTPHCARIHPAKLVRGLARAVERRGVRIYEQTRASVIAPSEVTTDRGRMRARFVLRATEGFTARLSGLRRAVAPVYSLVVATEPLAPSVWEQIGLDDRPTFSDHRHLIIYGQRSSDDRLVFGGRGAPYHFGSAVQPQFDHEERVFAALRETLVDLFPPVAGAGFTHAWGGPLGITRDWMASVGLDEASGLGWAGGYVGDGVTTTNLAGRTLADLVTQTDSELVRLPWVQHKSPQWEPEPLRWLGINAGLRAMATADYEERVTGRSSALARVMAPLVGGH